MKIAIYGSRRQQPYIELIEQFLTAMTAAGHKAVMHAKLFNHLQTLLPPQALQCVSRVVESTRFEADFAISLGGDGSFLRTAAWVADKQIPIIGVNTGHLGFLASLSVEDLPSLPALLADESNFDIEARSLLQIDCPGLRGWPYALNEATITKSESCSIISIQAALNGVDLADYRADGLIIATPTGSTAYNLSVGGPIVEPRSGSFCISAVAPHSLSSRPVILCDDVEITLIVKSRSHNFLISIDGRSDSYPDGTALTLRRAPYTIGVVKVKHKLFFDTLREKMMWGVDRRV